jgi:hypothetical protein
MAIGEAERLGKFRLAKRTRKIMRRTRCEDGIERGHFVARDQHEQRGGVGLHRIGERADRREPFLERAARIDNRDRRTTRHEAPLGGIGTAGRDHRPACALCHMGKLVALAEGQHEDGRRPPGQGVRTIRAVQPVFPVFHLRPRR